MATVPMAMGAGEPGFDPGPRLLPVDKPFVTAVQLEQDFAFRDARGKRWQADHGQVFDGSGFPPLFRDLIGSPLESTFPKSGILYEAMTQKMLEGWEASRHMFLEAALTEGVDPVEAKVMYGLLAVQGSRWETPDSRCFGSCHLPGKPLYWRPVAKEPRVLELVEWIRRSDPPVEAIDGAAALAIRATGPHIVTQPDCSKLTMAVPRYRLNCD